jgi:hypothetical protein
LNFDIIIYKLNGQITDISKSSGIFTKSNIKPPKYNPNPLKPLQSPKSKKNSKNSNLAPTKQIIKPSKFLPNP